MGNTFQYVLGKIIGTKNEREIKRISARLGEINALEPEMQRLADSDFPLRTQRLREKVASGTSLDAILPEAFALTREAGRRTLGMRHFDVQFIGGMVLHEGKIAEMKTGEGKTLVATLPVYLNALEGKGVHVVTVNDYLAKRDAAWMGPIYKLLGLSVGVIVHDLDDAERRMAYGADVTYGTNNEFGFDYLRDNMKFRLEDCVQRPHHFAIVDEVDSILIDEARTPLIISGSSEESNEKYYRINKVIPQLAPEDYEIDEKHRQAMLTETGNAKAEKILGLENLYDPANVEYVHHLQQALRAHTLYKLDRDYVVKEGEVIIVDEFTGRLMPGRRWSDGLHQAVEAKESVEIAQENQTLATVTFQNYFRMYKKLAGMTGTAETEAAEFEKIYKLEVVIIPTNKTLIRHEHPDVVYRTEREKFNAVIEEIKEYHLRGQPVLVGTIAIEKSEKLSAALRKAGVLPKMLLEAAKTAGLEGPKLGVWLDRLAQAHSPAIEWLIRAGVTASDVKKTLGERKFQAIASGASANGLGSAFMQALIKRGAENYARLKPSPIEEALAGPIATLVSTADEKFIPLLDYLLAIQCPPRRVIEVLGERELKHNVLNAKQHEREALIVAQAGRIGSVTVSTNMAGRGTDILLGGNPEFMAREEFRRNPEKYRVDGINPDPPERPPAGVSDEVFQKYVDDYSQWRNTWLNFVARYKETTDAEHDHVIELGGLHILGTERHEARRIDNQLRGRAGRQGDPGSSRFFLSLEDDLLRIFAGERISNIMHRLGMEEGVPIESKLISKRIEAAQRTVEAQNFESRKHLLEYDDVMNKQRETVYRLRRESLEGVDQKEYLLDAAGSKVASLIETSCPRDQRPDEWDTKTFYAEFWRQFGIDLRDQQLQFDPKSLDQLTDKLKDMVRQRYEDREQVWGAERMREHERMIMLQIVDAQWKDHLLAMDHLKEGIGLRGYSQRDPLVEYKRESFALFDGMMDRVEDEALRILYLLKTPDEEEALIREYQRRKRREQAQMQFISSGADTKPQQVIRKEKVGRNDPCPCGSGKKFKKCHGAGGAPPSGDSTPSRPSADN
jgi:preprotein translocase subunit SecA